MRQAVRLVLGELDSLVEQRLVRHDTRALDAAARRQNQLGLAVVYAGGELFRREAAEHDGMNGADARASQHAEHGFRHHRHIEDHDVALSDAEVAQHGAEQLHLRQHPAVSESLLGVSDRGIVDQRRLVVAGGDVAVERVVAGVDDAAGKPAAVEALRLVEHLFRFFDPVDGIGRLAPETFRVALPARVDVVVTAGAGVHVAFPSTCIRHPEVRAQRASKDARPRFSKYWPSPFEARLSAGTSG